MSEAMPEPIESDTSSIDTALARLDELDNLPVEEHPQVFDAIHSELREALTNAGREGMPPDSA